ncbi:MAG: lipopolysaccharide biosynthesis protein [Magnetovibrionaceae bacterium]
MIRTLTRISNLPVGVRQAGIFASALALSKGVSFLMVPITTRYLSPEDFGRLDILQTLADVVSLFIAFGLADTLFRYAGAAHSEEDRKASAANIFSIALVIGAVALILGQIGAPVVAGLLPGNVSLSDVRLILGSLAYSGIILVPLGWLRMQDRTWAYFAGSAGRTVAQAGLAATLLSLGFGVTGFLVAGFLTATVLAVVVSVLMIRDVGLRFDWLKNPLYAAYGAPLVLAGLAGFVLGSLDRWILAGSVGAAQMADYALAAKFGLMTAIAIQPFDMYWLPKRFQVLKAENGEKRAARMALFGVGVACLAACGVALAGPVVLKLITPDVYHGAAQYVPWLALLAALHATTTLLNLGCLTGDSSRRLMIVDGGAAAVALVGYLTLIPGFGAWGAIVATGLALSLRLITTVVWAQRAHSLPYDFVRMGLMGAGAVGVVWMPV